jgi:hypothetical protein
MAGTLVVAYDPRQAASSKRRCERVVVDWTCDASGNADIPLTLYGWLAKMVTTPDGTLVPTAYGVTLLDENGIDAMAGAGATRSTSATEQVAPTLSGSQVPVFLCGLHTFKITGAGVSKKGRAVFYVVDFL